MATTSFTLTYVVYGTDIDDVSIKNIKTQENPFTGVISEYGVAGDVAGILIQKLNSNDFSEQVGPPDREFKNFLSVNHFTSEEVETNKSDRINFLKTTGNQITFEGNFSDVEDAVLLSKLNIRLLLVYINYRLQSFLTTKIFQPNDFSVELESKLNEISRTVRKYLRKFDYDYEFDNRTVTINLYEEIGKPIDTLKFLIDYN